MVGRNPFRFWRTFTEKRALLACVLWFLVSGMLVAWFDPAEVKLWIIPMFAWWILFVLIVSASTYMNRSNKNNQRVITLLVGVFGVLVAVGNFLVPIWPNHRNPSTMMASAQEAISHITPQDLLVSAGFDWTGYVTYFSDEHRILNIINLAQSFGKEAVRPLILEKVSAIWKSGGHVYVVDYFSPGKDEVWQNWITPYTLLTPEDFSMFPHQVAWRTGNEIVWELLPPQ